MKSLMQVALGSDWDKLPPSLQAHYRFGVTVDKGFLDIEYPSYMQPYLSVLRIFGALVDRKGLNLPSVVEKKNIGDRQYWRRTVDCPEGKRILFNSFWVLDESRRFIEFVNPVLGLQMAVHVEDGKLYYRGIRFVAKLGRLLLPIPEWLALGHTTIIEEAIDDTHFAMDFRLTHPLLGQVFRYSGEFESLPG